MSKAETGVAVVTGVDSGTDRHFHVGSAEGDSVDYSVERDPERVDKIVADQSEARDETINAIEQLMAAAAVGLAAGAIAAVFATRRRKTSEIASTANP